MRRKAEPEQNHVSSIRPCRIVHSIKIHITAYHLTLQLTDSHLKSIESIEQKKFKCRYRISVCLPFALLEVKNDPYYGNFDFHYRSLCDKNNRAN